MGASVSKNVTKILINAVATISSKIVQDTNISYDSSQIIYVKDTKGDVIIRGNTMIQHAYINYMFVSYINILIYFQNIQDRH